ncbi:hypothetical protein D3C86_1789370 [compost metagenome]
MPDSDLSSYATTSLRFLTVTVGYAALTLRVMPTYLVVVWNKWTICFFRILVFSGVLRTIASASPTVRIRFMNTFFLAFATRV